MAAERRRAAAFDGMQHALLPDRQRCGMRSAKLVAVGVHNVGDFQCRPHKTNQRPIFGSHKRGTVTDPEAGYGADRADGQIKVAGCGGQTAVTQQELNFAEVRSCLQQMDSE
jgi:hypothetical protein